MASTETKTHGEMDSETTSEYHKLIERAKISEFFLAVGEEREPQGAEKELQDELGLKNDMIPLDMLECGNLALDPAIARINPQPTKSKPFGSRVADYLDIPMPRLKADADLHPDIAISARSSQSQWSSQPTNKTKVNLIPILTNKPPQHSSGYDASFFYEEKKAYLLKGMDAALQYNLSCALSAELDRGIINSLAKDYLIDFSSSPSGRQSRADLLDLLLYSRVDGIWAQSPESVKQVVSPEAYAILAKSYDDARSDGSAISVLNSQGGGVGVSAYLPAVDKNSQTQIVRIGSHRDAVFPIWEGITLIKVNNEYDRYRDEVKIIARVKAEFQLLRAEGFYRANIGVPSPKTEA
ncbi:MAG: hypothetical protein OXD43_14080 [Bacteroidetes bacterium]|nr:hypothetical protein [Bacteroidota bacterium]